MWAGAATGLNGMNGMQAALALHWSTTNSTTRIWSSWAATKPENLYHRGKVAPGG